MRPVMNASRTVRQVSKKPMESESGLQTGMQRWDGRRGDVVHDQCTH